MKTESDMVGEALICSALDLVLHGERQFSSRGFGVESLSPTVFRGYSWEDAAMAFTKLISSTRTVVVSGGSTRLVAIENSRVSANATWWFGSFSFSFFSTQWTIAIKIDLGRCGIHG